jgi:hypothetical protein
MSDEVHSAIISNFGRAPSDAVLLLNHVPQHQPVFPVKSEGTMRFPSILRRSSRSSSSAVDIKESPSERTREKEESTVAEETSGNGSSSVRDVYGYTVKIEDASLSTEGTPVMNGPMVVDKLPHEYEQDQSDTGYSATQRSTKERFINKLMALSQQHIEEIPEIRRAILLKQTACQNRSYSNYGPATMKVTPAVPTADELRHMSSSSSPDAADAGPSSMFLCSGCVPASAPATPDYSSPVNGYGVSKSGGTVQTSYLCGRSEMSPSLALRTSEEESLDRIFSNLAEQPKEVEAVASSPFHPRNNGSLVRDRLMLAQKQYLDEDDCWGGSTISSRMTNYIDQFDNV